MALLDRVAAARKRGGTGGRKGWSEPPFWARPDAWSLGAPWSTPDREKISTDFAGYVQGAYKADGIVFACILARQAIFSQARFGWRTVTDLRPGELFDSPGLELLRRPWPGGTTGELLARMESDASLAGNFWATVADDAGRLGRSATGPGRRIVRMRPDWVSLVIGSPSDDPNDLRAKVLGVVYEPPATGVTVRADPVVLLPSEVCHYSPIPDPEAKFRGMSWLTPIVREIESDKAATKHKAKFFENGAMLQTVMKLDKDISPEAFREFVKLFKENHRGADKAYETLFVGGGADASVISADLKQLDFKATQGAGETRIAAAAGVHPTIVGLSEGMQGSSLNSGNFGAARRLVADKTLRHLWSVAAASLETLLARPASGAELTVDTREIAFLREDQTDAAEIQHKQASTIRQLVDAGYSPESVVQAVQSEDFSLLEHSGLYSVQLQAPGTGASPEEG